MDKSAGLLNRMSRVRPSPPRPFREGEIVQVLKASPGKFKVIGVDTFEGPRADYFIGEYKTLAEASKVVDEHGSEMNPVYCYDDSGRMVAKAGSF